MTRALSLLNQNLLEILYHHQISGIMFRKKEIVAKDTQAFHRVELGLSNKNTDDNNNKAEQLNTHTNERTSSTKDTIFISRIL